jgi:hypothetical protein
VTIRDDLSLAQATKTFAHERAHILLGHVGSVARYLVCRGQCEVEAESVAYLVCVQLGIDAADYSLPYVARWGEGDVELIQKTAERVVTVARSILHAVLPCGDRGLRHIWLARTASARPDAALRHGQRGRSAVIEFGGRRWRAAVVETPGTDRRQRATSASGAATATARRTARAPLRLERVHDDLGLAFARTMHFLVDPLPDLVGRVKADQTMALRPSSLGRNRARHRQPTWVEQHVMTHTIDHSS